MRILIAGVNGYFGRILSVYLSGKGYLVTGIDRDISFYSQGIKYIQADIADMQSIEKAFLLDSDKFDVLIDLAADIDFAVCSQYDLYANNINCAKNLLKLALDKNIKRYIYTSSNSVYLGNENALIDEENDPVPIDAYGRSKLDSENYLINNSAGVIVNIIRCPNIIDVGRVGMLSILFELIESNANLWVVDGGSIRHQCIYAGDLCVAIESTLKYRKSNTFNIGSDNVPSFREMFVRLTEKLNSKSKIRSVPKFIVIPLLKLFYKLRLSPMGPYQSRMLTRSFIFDTHKIKTELSWRPTKTNSEILELAYFHYVSNKKNAKGSANRSPVKMGILSLLRYIKL